MLEADPKHFHLLYGVKRPRITYQKRDFIDYVLMTILTAAVLYLCYGPTHILTITGMLLCAVMVVMFIVRHGVEFRMPIILTRPQDIIYMLVHKILNIKFAFILGLSVLLLENYLIYLTPDIPHYAELMRKIGIYLFILHFGLLTIFRTVMLFSHLKHRELVKNVLLESPYWNRHITKQSNVTLEIFHAYFTGVLTHIVLIAPWYFIITHFYFSVLFLPLVCLINAYTSKQKTKVVNAWFYRDHWLGHNSEFEFVYLHGTHHDAIPSGLIGVAGNGFLEGFFRYILGYPEAFYNPVMATLAFTAGIKGDIDFHQYIPGVYPKQPRELYEFTQHSTHHFGRLEPYSFAGKLDQPNIEVPEEIQRIASKVPDSLANSAKLDEQLDGFEWDNSRYRWFLELYDKYGK